MSISSITSYMPSIGLASPVQIVSRLTALAVPIIALAGVSALPTVNAVTLAECYENCNAHRDAHELAKIICYALCHIFSKEK